MYLVDKKLLLSCSRCSPERIGGPGPSAVGRFGAERSPKFLCPKMERRNIAQDKPALFYFIIIILSFILFKVHFYS